MTLCLMVIRAFTERLQAMVVAFPLRSGNNGLGKGIFFIKMPHVPHVVVGEDGMEFQMEFGKDPFDP